MVSCFLFFSLLSVIWLPVVHVLCTLGFFCHLYNLLFIDQKKKKIRPRRVLTQEPTMALIPCEMREEKNAFLID